MFKYAFLAILAGLAYLLLFSEIQLTNDLIGQMFVGGIATAFVIFLFFKFGLHYKIA